MKTTSQEYKRQNYSMTTDKTEQQNILKCFQSNCPHNRCPICLGSRTQLEVSDCRMLVTNAFDQEMLMKMSLWRKYGVEMKLDFGECHCNWRKHISAHRPRLWVQHCGH
ncbi:E3 ubiquitin-protein ligase SH3RF1 [Frankliniella fusca]|uniref:E3 ubiquitin-protein ligase SH3RF1 n=1 Tax=Frankliniella fusca TaxID=407009 RepID=A0AAE1HNR9_9NEOP|nr:E3 ubiquitin-protein ligase SH3RF1 [Frankliniella fusca]